MLAFIHSSQIFFFRLYDMETHIDYRTLNIIQQIKYTKLDIQEKVFLGNKVKVFL